MLIQCKKCREVLANSTSIAEVECGTLKESSILYLQEDTLPAWIKTMVDESGWLKGRLNCPKCRGRIGSFDFVSGHKCDCKEHVLPPVHVIRSKVDIST